MMDFDFAMSMHILAVSFIPAVLGIIVHEVAHGYAAGLCGDPTAKNMGRLTLNPLPHIDPMGLIVFGLTSLSGAFVFGWAKPVPINPRFFHKPERDMMLVSLAGPMSNFILAVFFGLLLYVFVFIFSYATFKDNTVYQFALSACQAGVVINFGLCWLNLMPVPPLDGSKILAFFLPQKWAWRFMSLDKYGFVILLVLLFTGILGSVLSPLVRYSSLLLFNILGF